MPKTKKPKSHKKPKKPKKPRKPSDPHALKDAKSSYFEFMEERRPLLQRLIPNGRSSDITKKMNKMWTKLTEEQKEPYNEKQKLNKEKYEIDRSEYQHTDHYQSHLRALGKYQIAHDEYESAFSRYEIALSEYKKMQNDKKMKKSTNHDDTNNNSQLSFPEFNSTDPEISQLLTQILTQQQQQIVKLSMDNNNNSNNTNVKEEHTTYGMDIKEEGDQDESDCIVWQKHGASLEMYGNKTLQCIENLKNRQWENGFTTVVTRNSKHTSCSFKITGQSNTKQLAGITIGVIQKPNVPTNCDSIGAGYRLGFSQNQVPNSIAYWYNGRVYNDSTKLEKCGDKLKLNDILRVKLDFKEQRVFFYLNGKKQLSRQRFKISKESEYCFGISFSSQGQTIAIVTSEKKTKSKKQKKNTPFCDLSSQSSSAC